MQAAVGELAGNLRDLTSVAQSHVWLDFVAVATLSALLVAGSSFGVLELLLGGSNPLLGGPGYLDPITTISVLSTVLGITVLFSHARRPLVPAYRPPRPAHP